MEIIFATKEENNERREKEFLALSYAERLAYFSQCWMKMNSWEKTKTHPNDTKGNFILR